MDFFWRKKFVCKFEMKDFLTLESDFEITSRLFQDHVHLITYYVMDRHFSKFEDFSKILAFEN